MIPSYPSLTFPNHYTIVTGVYPAHHGLVDNSFYDAHRHEIYQIGNRNAVRDGSWYGGTPLWVLAEKQQMLSACFYWVGSEAAIQGISPTYFYYYNDKIGIDERIEVVKQWLQLPAEQRPHFITFYLPQVDHAAHRYGPESPQTADAVHFVDAAIGHLVAVIDTLHLPVSYVFVSDHGMTTVDTVHALALPAAVDTSQFIIPSGDALLQLYAKDKRDVLPTYAKLKTEAKEFDVYLPDETPSRWHYTREDDKYDRIGDIILVPHLPYAFSISNRKVTPGKHGYDPALMDMRATFYAWGPAFKSHLEIGDFENINIYPLIAKILGLTYSDKIDGKPEVLEKILK